MSSHRSRTIISLASVLSFTFWCPVSAFAATPTAEAGVNLALHKTYVSSSTNKSGWDVGLTDGSFEKNRLHTYATDRDDAFPKTVVIDLEQPAALGSIVVGVPPFGGTKTIEVAISVDGKSFTTVGSHKFAQHQEVRYTYSFAETSARYVRLTFPDHWEDGAGNSPNYIFVEEVEAYSPDHSHPGQA